MVAAWVVLAWLLGCGTVLALWMGGLTVVRWRDRRRCERCLAREAEEFLHNE